MLETRVTAGNGIRHVIMHGELDMNSASILKEAAITKTQDEVQVVLDFAEVDFVDSTGLHALLQVLRENQQMGRNVQLVNVNPAIGEIFAIVGLDELISK